MKTLILLRHAKSSHNDGSLTDHDRPLNQRGRHDAPRIGKLLSAEELLPDVIISSTARRTRDTTELLVAAASYRGPVTYRPELYLASPDDYRGQLLALPDECATAMLVGHNPGMEELLAGLTGEHQDFPTAAVAVIELPIDHWADISRQTHGRLLNFWRPRELEGD